MSPGIALVVGLFLVPVVSHLDGGTFIFALIADESIGEAPFRVFVLAQNLHAENSGVEVECLFLIEYADHRVVETKVGSLIAHGLPLFG